MSNITLSAPVFYRAGVAGVSPVVGVESNCSRVARYSFTAPATGACAVSVDLAGAVFVEGTRPQRLGFFIGTDPLSHANGGTPTGYLTGEFSGSAELLLLPNIRYYLFLFPVTADYGWYTLELATVTLTASGGSYSVPTLSASTVEMGNPVTIFTNRHDAAFTHRISYVFGSTSGTIAENVTDSCTWTPSVELARQIPNAETGVGAVYCATYSGGTQIGSTQQVPIYLTVPASVVPTAEVSWEDSSGAFDKLGAYVQNVSRLAVTVKGTGSLGSTITGASVTLDGKPYSGAVLTVDGERTLVGTVTDSRGRPGSDSGSITVAPYAAPRLTLNASRCTEDGTADDTGEFCKVTITGGVTQVGGQNTAALSFTYGSTTKEIAVAVGDFTHSEIVPAPSTDTLKLTATLSDALLSTSRQLTLSVGYATLDFLAGGRGIAFGTTATREGFTCAMDAYFSGELYRLNEGEKEWLFPPMLEGVEYRTAERYNGKPVYTRLINCGQWTAGKEVTLVGSGTILRHTARAGEYQLPFIYNRAMDSAYTCIFRIEGRIGRMDGGTGVNWSAITHVQIWYTK